MPTALTLVDYICTSSRSRGKTFCTVYNIVTCQYFAILLYCLISVDPPHKWGVGDVRLDKIWQSVSILLAYTLNFDRKQSMLYINIGITRNKNDNCTRLNMITALILIDNIQIRYRISRFISCKIVIVWLRILAGSPWSNYLIVSKQIIRKPILFIFSLPSYLTFDF